MPNDKQKAMDPWIIQEEIDRQRREEEEEKRKQPVLDLPLESPETEPAKPKKESERTITWNIGETPPSDDEDRDEETNDGVVHRWKM